MRNAISAFAGGLCFVVATTAAAAPGVNEDRVLFGQSAAFEGPAAALGTNMRRGLKAAFTEVNADGGVDGRRLEMVTYDDGYEPDAAIENVKKLINDDRVFSLIGEVGTPTSKAVQPIAEDNGVPFIAPFTGASFLRKDEHRRTINVRASYCQEAEAWIRHLTKDLGVQDVALLYQDDSYGRVGLTCVGKALEERDMELAARATYPRNTTAVKRAFLTLRRAEPDAVTMVGAYEPVAEFIKLARRFDLDIPYVNISFVGSKALSDALGDAAGEGVIVSQVVPFPWSDYLPLAEQYRAALDEVAPDAEPGFVSFEGYIAGRIAAKALANVDGDLTRASYVDAFYDLGAFEMGGVQFDFGDGDNQALDEVFMTVIQDDGSFEQVKALEP